MTAPEAQPTAAEPATKPLTAREKAKLNQVPVHDPLIGQVIGGHYEVIECVGKGGMSIVYKTRHQLINQYRAIKILLPHRDNEADCLLRFQLEATAASRMDNTHIVRIHDFVAPEASAPYLVMDFVDGTALGDEIDRLGRLSVKRSLSIFVQILDAIGHTHARGVIHRDLKPDNILLVNDEVEGPDFVKLIDFGIAKLTAADKLQPQGLTPTGEVFGSPQYMSPEQCAALQMDARSEIYSLGCILYEMLSGRAPLLGKSVLETLNMQAHTPATPLSKLSIEPPLVLPRGLDEIVMRCLAKKPEDRYQNTEELAKALTTVPSFDRRRQINTKIGSVPVGAALFLATSALLVTFALGFGLAKLLPGGPPPKGEIVVSGQSSGDPEIDQWQSLYVGGQKALNNGDLTAASSKLEAALSKANSLNDGQKRSAATGIDLNALGLIKQFKTAASNEAASHVSLAESYPNNPWETKISAMAELLRSKPEGEDQEKAIYRPTIELLEESHKGNLTSLNGLLKLAQEKIPNYKGVSVRDKLRLALAIAAIEEEQGYTERARNLLKSQSQLLAALGQFDPLSARFYMIESRLALAERELRQAAASVDKAQNIYDENVPEHTTDLLDVALLHSDIALANDDANSSLKSVRLVLPSLDQAPASDRLQVIKDKLLLRLAQLDPGAHLNSALTEAEADLEREEAKAPKDVAHLITALNMSYCLNKLKESQSTTARPKLWRAVGLALATGRLATASALMQPLMVSYDTPLTQNELFKIASSRSVIDEALAAAGNHNQPALLDDYVLLGEALEDFSLGPARNLKDARAYLNKATVLSEAEGNRINHLTVARVYFFQARCALERKVTPSMVDTLLHQAKREIRQVQEHSERSDQQAPAAELAKKVKELEQENLRTGQK